jgi:hypothetical protein
LLQVRVGANYDKLVAAETKGFPAITDSGLNRARGAFKSFTSGAMAVAVIDRFQMIDVDE